jgi:hypothetical protein
MPWVYRRPEGYTVEGVISLRCPCCGQVGPAQSMAKRMTVAANDQTLALWQRPGGRGRMSKAVRLNLDQLLGFMTQGDVRARAAVYGLRTALAALIWLDLLRAPTIHPAAAEWASKAAHDVGKPMLARARVEAPATPIHQGIRTSDLGTYSARAKVIG